MTLIRVLVTGAQRKRRYWQGRARIFSEFGEPYGRQSGMQRIELSDAQIWRIAEANGELARAAAGNGDPHPVRREEQG